MRYVMAFDAEDFAPFTLEEGFESGINFGVALFETIQDAENAIEEFYVDNDEINYLVKFFEVNDKEECTRLLCTKRIQKVCKWTQE